MSKNRTATSLLAVLSLLAFSSVAMATHANVIGGPTAANGWSTTSAVSAYSSSGQHSAPPGGRAWINTVNGAGISGTHDEDHEYLGHSTSPFDMGVTSNCGGFIAGDPYQAGCAEANPRGLRPGTVADGSNDAGHLPHTGAPVTDEAAGHEYIEYKFDQVYSVLGARIWNYNEGAWGKQGFNEITIQASQTGGESAADWTTVFAGTLAQAGGADGDLAQEVAFGNGVLAKHIIMVSSDDPATKNFTGGSNGDVNLAEMWFVFPEPATIMGLVAVIPLALLRRRRTA